MERNEQTSRPVAGLFLLAAVLMLAACGGEGDGPGDGDAGSDGSADTGSSSDADSDVAPPDSEETTGEARPALRFDPLSEDFFDLPMPCDFRRDEDGRIRFSEWEGLMGIGLSRLWMEAADELVEGWGVTNGAHLWFEAAIDASSLPATMEETLWEQGEPAPAVFMIDVDPESPEQGRTFPLEFAVRNEQAALTPGYRLAAMPPFGIKRRPLTRYALVVTSALLAEDGAPFAVPEAMQALLAGEAVESRRAGTVSAESWTEAADLLEARGLPREEIVGLVLFTTADPSARLRRVAEWGRTLPTPELGSEGLSVFETLDAFTVLAGSHSAPVYQSGTRPYGRPPAGQIIFGEDGNPVVTEQQFARFNVSIPPGPMPEDGWPLLLYMHGSGSNWTEPIVRGAPTEPEVGYGTARVAAEAGWATVGFDFPLHGDRSVPPDTTGLRLYNLMENPRATVDNFIVSAVENMLRTRFLMELTIDPALSPETLDAGDAADGLIRFNPERIAAFGQSMGSTLAIPWATIDENVGALFLHGSGGMLIDIAVAAVQPFQLKGLLEITLGYATTRPSDSLDRFDPVLHWLQHYWDIVDPIAHSRHVSLEPHAGIPPKHIYQFSGIDDGYFSVRSRTAMAAALGIDALEPTVEPWFPRVLGLAGLDMLDGPVTANMPDGSTTGVSVEWCPLGSVRGHYVAFDLIPVREHMAAALQAFAEDGVLTVPVREGFSTACDYANLDEDGAIAD